MRSALMLPIIAVTGGCTSGDVLITGTVLQNRLSDVGLADAAVEVRDDRGDEYSSTIADTSGGFETEAPRGRTVYLGASGQDDVVASFTGIIGQEEQFDIPERLLDDCGDPITLDNGDELPTLYAVEASDVEAVRTLFAGCPGADAAGGILVGRVRYFLFAHDEAQEAAEGENACFLEDFTPPPVRNAVVIAESLSDASVYDACYLDPEGIGYDATATNAGASQAFAIFGLPEGTYTAVVRYDLTDDVFTQAFYNVWVPENGVVPRYPMWVEFPGPS